MVNANNPSHYKLIIGGLFVTLFGIYIKQFIEHSMVIDLAGWALTFIGAFISIAGVLILYILIQTVAQGVLGDSLATYKENPLSIVANLVFGPIGFTILTVGAAVSMFGTLSSELLGMPRVLFRASKDKVLPFKPLTKVHDKYATPYVSVIVYASLGFLFSSLGGFKQLAVFSSATILLVYLGVSLSVLKLRKKNMLKEGGFKIPGGYTVPILSSLIIVWLLTNLNQFEVIAIAVFITVLSLMYFLRKKFKKTLK